jgi:tetratricopeptide (TPR) repeat protein
MIYALVAVLLIGLAVVLWQALGRGPRRRRAFVRAQRLLDAGDWEQALSLLEALRAPGLSEAWRARLRKAEGAAHQQAADQLLQEKRFEDALEHLLTSAPLLDLDQAELRARVVDNMLAEVRRLFALTATETSTGVAADTDTVIALLQRTFALSAAGQAGEGTPCPEASFWLALCHVRKGQLEPALGALRAAQEKVGRHYIDPSLYLGVLHHRLGRPQEALRYLAEANRVEGSCPLVTWQMGVSLIASGGDSGLALRALQRALGSRGLSLWLAHPERLWVEGFPEGRSYVRKLASKHRFVCPLLGGDLATILRQGQFALAQAFYRQEKFAESADLFGKLLQDSPPTVGLLRGYGLALARLRRYDEAYKHLRSALEQEEPKGPFTAGYLALCGALGKPTQLDDKPKNVAWAIRLLARYPLTGNAEWAGLISAVLAEARALEMPLGLDEQLLLCDTLASVNATDPQAAAGYAHLAATFPEAVRPGYAWLYVRAATAAGVSSPHDLLLFSLTFRDPGPAREHFAKQQWSFDEVEYKYLERSAAQAPGRFPPEMGADYAPKGEAFLLARSRQEEEAGHKDQARACVEVLLRLAPGSVAGHDRLACLHYRRGEMDQSLALLGGWQRLDPADHWPVVRQAILEQERGNAERRAEAIDRALGLTRGPLRAAVAYLGARLALRASALGKDQGPRTKDELAHSLALLERCLQDAPDHTEALWCLAAVRSVLGDGAGLAAQAPLMNRPKVLDARFHFLGGVCHLAAHDYERALELGQRAAADPALELEGQYVLALAHVHLANPNAARQALQRVAAADKSPSAPYARAVLGQLSFARGAYDDAIKWWNALDAQRRAEWRLDDTLRQTVLLSGLLALEGKRYEQAADRFREAGKLGLRDRRLGGLLTLALVKAGQRLLYEHVRKDEG